MSIISTFPEKKGLNADDINDIAAGEINNGFVQSSTSYSTEEQVVGKWIDGKPLYQKTIFISSINMGSWTRSTIDTTNLLDNEHITVYNMFGGYYADFGGPYQQFHLWGDPGFVKENERYGYSAHYRQAQKQIAIDGTWGNMAYTINNLSFTFQYTRTTD